MRRYKGKRGTLNFDFILAVGLFVSVYASVYYFLPYLTIGSMETQDPVMFESRSFSDSLLRSPGYPPDWSNVDGALKIGLAYYDMTSYANILDFDKVNSISTKECEDLKSKTDFTRDFLINVVTELGSLNCSATIPENARLIERTAYLYDGENYKPAKLQVYVW